MSKKSNPTLIGGFVVGALVLLVAAVALFGGSEFFAKRLAYVAYFDDSTKGLRVGSNVTLNGVRVGYVDNITLLVEPSPVIEVQITNDKFPRGKPEIVLTVAEAEDHDKAIKKIIDYLKERKILLGQNYSI